jgi:outer membrane protein TolC
MAQDAPKPRVLTLDDAIRIAVQRNPTIGQAEDRIVQSEARVGQARAGNGIQISTGGAWAYSGPNPSFSIPDSTGKVRTINLGSNRTRTGRITGTLPLDVAGKVRASTQVAKRGVNVSRFELDRTANSLVLDVQTAYYNALRAREFVRVAQESVTAAQEHRRIAQANFNEGNAPEFDVLRAAVQVSNLQQTLVTAQTNTEQALVGLKQVLGLGPDEAIDVLPIPPTSASSAAPGTGAAPGAPAPAVAPQPSPETPGAAQTAPSGTPAAPPGPSDAPSPGSLVTSAPPLQLDVPALLQEAYRARPEVLQADENVRLAEASVRLERKGLRPDLALSGNYNFSPDSAGLSPVTESWSVGATLSWPVFDSGLTRNRVKEALGSVSLAKDAREQVRQGIEADVRSSVLSLTDATQRATTARANVVQAREALRIARVRYENGVSTGVEVTDSEVALTQAETNAVNADFDVLVAQAGLDKALGRLLAVAKSAREGGRP